jgi:hypothetical protein
MLTAPALSTAVPASADDRETACRGQTAHLVEKGFRRMNGLLARHAAWISMTCRWDQHPGPGMASRDRRHEDRSR